MSIIYLDNNATTPMDPRVFEAMKPYFLEKFGNPSSKEHAYGWEAEKATDIARKQAADLINASPAEIYFTNGATESINLAHFGLLESYYQKGNKIITTPIEHSAVLDSLKALEHKGCEIVYLTVDSQGEISLDELNSLIDEKTILVSIMTANNEIGVINNVAEIGKICKSRGVFFHTDATQAVGNIPFDLKEIQADMVSFSAHKFYGPKGTGALYINNESKIKLTPRNYGGGQERHLRPGTLNVPGIVGLGKAAELAMTEAKQSEERIFRLRNKLLEGIRNNIEDIHINGSLVNRLPGNLNISFKYLRSENIILNLRDIAVSSGSACASSSLKPSHILTAMGVTDDYIRSAVRFGVGRFNTEEEIDYTIEKITDTVAKLRAISPEYQIKLNKIES